MQVSVYRTVLVAFSLAFLLVQRRCAVCAVELQDFYPNAFSDETLQRSSGTGPSYHTLQLTDPVRFYGSTHSAITVREIWLLSVINILAHTSIQLTHNIIVCIDILPWLPCREWVLSLTEEC